MLALLAALSAIVESETAVAEFILAELQGLRARTDKADRRVAELREIIEGSTTEALRLSARPTRSNLSALRAKRERVEAAVAELEVLDAEYRAIDDAAAQLLAGQALTIAFQPPMALA